MDIIQYYPDFSCMIAGKTKDSKGEVFFKTHVRIFNPKDLKWYITLVRYNYCFTEDALDHQMTVMIQVFRRIVHEVHLKIHLSDLSDIGEDSPFMLDPCQDSEQERLTKQLYEDTINFNGN